MTRLTDSLPDISLPDVSLPDIPSVSVPATDELRGLADDAGRRARRLARSTGKAVGYQPSRTITRNRVMLAIVAVVAVAGIVTMVRKRRSGQQVGDRDDQFTRAA
jgi:hypothetical protein